MKKIFIALAILLAGWTGHAQITKAELQASGLTCSMCSKAVLNALEKISFVDKVQVNIKTQEYALSFKAGAPVDLDALSKAVQNAGFSVAALKATASLGNIRLEKDEHVKIGGSYFHFLNATGQQPDHTVTFTVVDKGFAPAKDVKKYSALSKMGCVKTGYAAACCDKGALSQKIRIYHVII
jgi:copper chaperone CopZ